MSTRIRNQRAFFLKAIADAREELENLKLACHHEDTFEGNYEWRLGASYRAIICHDCGAVIKNLDYPIPSQPKEQ
jgi:hypothetical protein